ncbi:MAG TPA: BTAD domain-containing putative transcriptional regulator [Nocardioides sp.]|uniref:AfsR/SARP family transcriptional regulator n=1 Tax=Nocardioides sp. TaxID=35761 RepID=UPI002D8083BC|nr:BTAD domain-containing putative transcriptional regulator [Nocardioides sp.]HET6651142.1 BTAD domain-containing putative transcriptional regulator [Nocardioides sp.]
MWEISLFGGTTVRVGDRVVTGGRLGGVKPRRLLEALALTPGRAVSKEVLADRLWGENPPRSYVATLESYVCVLRRSVGAPGGRDSWLATTPGGYLLDPRLVSVDLAEARHALRCAPDSETAVAVRLTEAAVGLDEQGLLVESAGDHWVDAVRRDFTAKVVAACVHTADRCLDERELVVAARLAREALRRDPFAEAAVQVLLRALTAQGRRSEAIRVFRDFRRLLVDELGIDPDTETLAAYLDVLRRRGGHTEERRSGESEARLLLELLRQALESTGLHVGTDTDLAMRALARHLHVAA